MNPDFSQNEREQLEAKITALLLGELSAGDAAALGKAMEQDAELKALYERLKVTIELVREGAVNPTQPATLKMSAERREKLLARFKTIVPEEFARARRSSDWFIPAAVAAACVMILGALLLPALSRAKSKGMRASRSLSGREKLAEAETRGGEIDQADVNGRENKLMFQSAPTSSVTMLLSRTVVKGDMHEWGSSLSGASVTNGLPASLAPKEQIVLPAGDQVARNGRGETTSGTWDFSPTTGAPEIGALGHLNPTPQGTFPLNYAESADVSEALKKLAGEGTNNLSMNEPALTLDDGGASGTGSGGGGNLIVSTKSMPVAGGRPADIASAKNPSGQFPPLESGTISVDPNTFYKNLPADAGVLAGPKTDAGPTAGLRYVTGLDPTVEVQSQVLAFFRTNGVDLNAPGRSVFFNDRQGTITIHGTDEDLKRAEEAINTLNGAHPGVVVNAKFAEVNQQSNGAYGFNRYAGQFSTNGTVTASGGTMPQSVQVAKADNAPDLYRAAQEDLESKKRWREILEMKTSQELVDKELPRVRMVSVMDPAKAEQAEKPGWGEKLKESLSGKVERTARIQVEQEHPDISGLPDPSMGQGYDPYFLQTEFETIQSHAVLSNVVASLDLKDVWGKKYNDGQPMTEANAEALIKKNLDLSAVKNTKFIEIGVKDESPEEAARIANAVAAAYRQYRMDEYDALKSHGIASLQQQLAEQDMRVKLAQANVDRLAKEVENVRGANPTATQNDSAFPKPAVPPPTPQPEILTRENAVSTFSLNVSDVSFKLAAASLRKGQMPEPASIRSEEFINAFDYRDPDAGPGVPIAFAAERARYPFAHNRELLRFSLKTAAAGRQEGRPLNIVLLLDNSGSMERADRVRIIQEALRVLASQLKPTDTFSVVTFARTAQLRVDGVPGNQAAAAAVEIAKLTPEGGTNLGEALDLAYETALHHYLPKGDNRVVVLTDGAANLGDVKPETLKQKVEAHRKQGVALDCFGIGWEGYNDDLLEVLARNGDGRYGFINSPEEATTTFVSQIAGALHVAAADVKVQVEFNPKRVTSYRQIGYAKHQLTKEQFRDNTVDAAEIAAQEAGNALYTVETNPQGEGSIATVRVRYKIPGTGEYREQAWDVPYTGGAVALEQASPAMRLAATASAFSEWLAGSPFATGVTTDQLLNYLKGVPQVYGADTRPKDLEWMVRQAKSISGE